MENKLCPLRKETYYYTDTIIESQCITALSRVPDAEYTQETFLPCLKDRCMFYNLNSRNCVLTYKFNFTLNN